jgi:hypothetical protein
MDIFWRFGGSIAASLAAISSAPGQSMFLAIRSPMNRAGLGTAFMKPSIESAASARLVAKRSDRHRYVVSPTLGL